MNQFVKENIVVKYILAHTRAVKHSLLMFTIMFVFGLVFSTGIIKFFQARSPFNLHYIQTNPSEIFILVLKIAVIFAFVTSFPMITYYLVKPSFRKYADKRRIILTLAGGFSLFVIGILLASWVTIPAALYFLIGLNFNVADININISDYISFCLLTVLFSGLLFIIPIVRQVLKKMNLLEMDKISKYWKYAAVIAVSLPAVIISNQIFEILFYASSFFLLYALIIFIIKVSG